MCLKLTFLLRSRVTKLVPGCHNFPSFKYESLCLWNSLNLVSWNGQSPYSGDNVMAFYMLTLSLSLSFFIPTPCLCPWVHRPTNVALNPMTPPSVETIPCFWHWSERETPSPYTVSATWQSHINLSKESLGRFSLGLRYVGSGMHCTACSLQRNYLHNQIYLTFLFPPQPTISYLQFNAQPCFGPKPSGKKSFILIF